jgi:large subunit ribosomal protein L35Ae
MTKGIIVQFRRGRHRIHERHYLLDIGMKDRAEAKKMSGKEVEWKSSAGKVIKGKISDAHGNNGIVRAIFEKGLPGQAITTEIEVKEGIGKKEDKKDDKKKNDEKKN